MKKRLLFVLLLVFTLFIVSCGPTPKVDSDTDTSKDSDGHGHYEYSEFSKLIETYDKMDPKELAFNMKDMEPNGLAWFRLYLETTYDMFHRACLGDDTLTLFGASCGPVIAERNQYKGSEQLKQFQALVKVQQPFFVEHYKCTAGTLSGSPCEKFKSAQVPQPNFQAAPANQGFSQPAAQQQQQVPSGKTPFEYFIDTFDQMSAESIARHVAGLSPQELQTLQIFSYIGFEIHYRACAADSSIVFEGKNCQQMAQDKAMAQQYALPGAPEEWTTDRLKIQNMYACERGEISAGTCQAGIKMQANINQMQHETSMGIINNLPTGTCRRYIDPNCY